jgi:hypothetical protein
LYINLKKKQLADMDAVEGYILDREVILEAILLDEAMGKGEKRRSGVAKWF